MAGTVGGFEVSIGREGYSTKSPPPRDIPEKGTKIKPWSLLYLVGAPLKYGLMVDSEAGSQQSKIRTTSCVCGGGRLGFQSRAGGQRAEIPKVGTVWEEQGWEGLFCPLKILIKETGATRAQGGAKRDTSEEEGGCVSPLSPQWSQGLRT